MKKKFITAMTTALVVGAASTTFAAANPFSDVPAGHWAYDAVTQLAADGIVEGYGDGTYLGNRNITRYEMAQMVAKAMAKNTSGADQALIDRLAAEFSEELNNLGVRVSELEKYADKVQWTGELRYRYASVRNEQDNGHKIKNNRDWVQFRLFPTAEVNNHWKLKARMTAGYEMDKDDSTDFALTYGYAQGDYNKFTVKVGKQDFFDNVGSGLVIDDFFSGARVEVGSKWKLNLEAGRWNLNDANDYITAGINGDDAANYQGAELIYDTGSKFMVGAQYRHLNSSTFKNSGWNAGRYNLDGKAEDDASIWGAGIGYNFDKNVKLSYAYAQNTKADDYDRSWTGQLSYKGADKKAGSWGAWAAYRYIGSNVSLMPTYDVDTINNKGVELGLSWSPLNNTLTVLQYFKGKQLDNNENDTETLFARVSFFF